MDTAFLYFLAIPDMTVFALQSYVRVLQTERNGRYTRGVVRLPSISEQPGNGREGDNEVQRVEIDHILKDVESLDLGEEHALEALLGVRGEYTIGK